MKLQRRRADQVEMITGMQNCGKADKVPAGAVQGVTHDVVKNNPGANYRYTRCATAAAHIQQAADACVDGDEVVVTSAVYDNGFGVTPEGPFSLNGVRREVYMQEEVNWVALWRRCEELARGARHRKKEAGRAQAGGGGVWSGEECSAGEQVFVSGHPTSANVRKN